MQAGAAFEMAEARFRAVQQLQQQELADLGDAAATRLLQAPGQRIGALLDQALDLAQKTHHQRMRIESQHRRDVIAIQHQQAVAATFEHPRHAQAQPAIVEATRIHQPQARFRQLHLGGLTGEAVLVAQQRVAHPVARQRRRRLFEQHVLGALARQRQSEVDELAHGAFFEADRRRQLGVLRQRERRAVGQHTLGRAQRQLAHRQRGLVDLEPAEAPEVRLTGQCALVREELLVAGLLLEVLGPQEHALGPGHALTIRHQPRSTRASG